MPQNFIKGQIIYRKKGGIYERWIYVRLNGKEHILIDENQHYGYFTNLGDFWDTKTQCKIHEVKKEMKSLTTETHIIKNKISYYNDKVKEGESILKDVEDKLESIQKDYKYLQEKHPEEFI